MTQQQFLDVVDRDTAVKRFRDALPLGPLDSETVLLGEALGRVLAENVAAPVDVPSFDRVNYDGYAVRAADTSGAAEEVPVRLRLLDERLATARVPQATVVAGTAMSIATGGMLPRGADAVVMIEHTDEDGDALIVRKAVASGFGVAFAGTDMSAGETVLRAGQLLTSRDTGVLAAVGVDRVAVYRRPRVAIVSTGDELIAPGEPMTPAMVYDSNARIVADAVRECGGEPIVCGIVHDDVERLRHVVRESLATADVVVLSGGTSKGDGDLSYRVVHELTDPGVVVHGVALKPGKPICLAVSAGKPVVVLPGFPTSAIFTFHEFVAPVLRELAGRGDQQTARLTARMAVDVTSALGRREYLMVGLVRESADTDRTDRALEQDSPRDAALVAYPMPGGSGSVTTFSRA
ncbi:MAG: hypothetical protein KDA63_15270, partial [Planctomycetales bacterium]|nr:hypothetical protein [Planctomycetales bacterium]